MKKYSLLLIIAAFLVFYSWATNKPKLFNSNSWSISIGKKVLLASWQNNKMRDTAIIEQKKIKLADTLFVTQYLCGYNGQNSYTTLIIKNDVGQVVKRSTNKNNQLMYVAKLSLADILASGKFTNNKVLSIYCSIYSKEDKIDQTLLVGKLRLK